MPRWHLPYNVPSIRHLHCRHRNIVLFKKDCALLPPALQYIVNQTFTVPSTKECAVNERLCLTGTCIRMCRPPNINVPSTKDCALLAPAFQCAFHQTLTVAARKDCALLAPALQYTVHQTFTVSPTKDCAVSGRLCLPGICVN